MKRIVNITLSVLLLSFILLLLFTSCEKHEHAFGEWQIALEPTCVAEGIEERTCECGEKETKAIPMAVHKKGNWVEALAATCTEEGLEERVCECGEKETRPLAMIDHQPSDWYTDVAENVFGKGSKRIYCTHCKVTLQTKEIPQFVSQGLEYTVNPDGVTCTVTGLGSASRYHIGIPTEIDGYKVTAIGDRAFAREDGSENTFFIFIPEGVTHIGEYAFANNAISRISIPNSLETLACYAFGDITYASNGYNYAEYFGNEENPYVVLLSAANRESVTSVEVHKNTRIIYNNAFSYCKKLEKVTIPDGVHTIGESCFYQCDLLKEVTLPASLKIIKKGAFKSCYSLKQVVIPENVAIIEEEAFYGCSSLEKVNVLGTSLTTIDTEAFAYCWDLVEINIPNSLKKLGDRAFVSCSKLIEVHLPDNVEYTGYAFSGCDSLKLNEYGNMMYLGRESNPYFILVRAKNNMIDSCHIHEDTEYVASRVFYVLEYLKSVSIPEHLAPLFEDTFFSHCPVLEKVIVHKGTTYLCAGKFYMCTFLKEVVLPQGIKEVYTEAFAGCRNIESLTFLDGLEVICDSVFSSCLKLKSIYLPGSLQEIQEYAFDECTSLTDIYFDGTKEQWKKIQKGENWDRGTAKYTVHCTDGDIKK